MITSYDALGCASRHCLAQAFPAPCRNRDRKENRAASPIVRPICHNPWPAAKPRALPLHRREAIAQCQPDSKMRSDLRLMKLLCEFGLGHCYAKWTCSIRLTTGGQDG